MRRLVSRNPFVIAGLVLYLALFAIRALPSPEARALVTAVVRVLIVPQYLAWSVSAMIVGTLVPNPPQSGFFAAILFLLNGACSFIPYLLADHLVRRASLRRKRDPVKAGPTYNLSHKSCETTMMQTIGRN